MPTTQFPLVNDYYDRVLRFAAEGHRDQFRRGSLVPYIVHPIAVARIVERAGFDEATVAAALLHDLVEDTTVTLNDIGMKFDAATVAIVAGCTEIKHDAQGEPIPWEERKQAHLDRLRVKPLLGVRAVMLADKLDNLRCIGLDLKAGRPVWDQFHAGRGRVLWYYEAMIITCECGDRRVRHLADACRRELEAVRTGDPENRI